MQTAKTKNLFFPSKRFCFRNEKKAKHMKPISHEQYKMATQATVSEDENHLDPQLMEFYEKMKFPSNKFSPSPMNVNFKTISEKKLESAPKIRKSPIQKQFELLEEEINKKSKSQTKSSLYPSLRTLKEGSWYLDILKQKKKHNACIKKKGKLFQHQNKNVKSKSFSLQRQKSVDKVSLLLENLRQIQKIKQGNTLILNSLKKTSQSLDYFVSNSMSMNNMQDTMEKFKGRKEKKKKKNTLNTEPVFDPIGSVSPWLQEKVNLNDGESDYFL